MQASAANHAVAVPGRPRRPQAISAIAVFAAGLLPACDDAERPEKMVVREVVRELLVGEGDWTVTRERTDSSARVDILTPSISWRVDGGDLPALVLPPPSAVELVVDETLGPVVLRVSAGIDRAAWETKGIPDVGFRVSKNGKVVFDERVPVPRDDKGKKNAWRHVGGDGGLFVSGGDRILLETLAPPSAPAIDAGYGRMWLERHTGRPRAEATAERPNIVVVVMDTQRRDRISALGHARETTPNVDRLAARGISFERAYATSSWTWPSTASILTGLLPQRHGVLDYSSCTLPNALQTLPEALQQAGYTTAGFSGNPLISADKNFGQGFETFRASRRFEKSEEFVGEALEWMQSNSRSRFFLYLQLVEPHMEYLPSDAARAAIVGERPADFPPETGDAIERYGARLFEGEGRTEDGWATDHVVPADHQRYIDELYDASVRTGDEWVGRVLETLASLDLLDTTVVVFTSDHGEELFDHGFFEHGHSLHAELVGVPLVLAGPRVLQGKRVKTPVSNRHLAATLARIGGATMHGIDDPLDLCGLVEERPVFLSTRHGWWDGWVDQPIRGVVVDGFVLHHAPEAGAWNASEPTPGGESRLYRLDDDPSELVDRAAENEELVRALVRAIEERFEREAEQRVSMAIPAGAATEAMLRDVGYLGQDEDDDD